MEQEINNNINKNRWLILFVVVMVTFMCTLDGSIVNVALPVMSKVLDVTTSGIQLVVTSYLIVIAATILVFGRLGDILGKVRVFKFGLVLFTLGSLFCGLTSSFSLLVLARIIQGIGAAGCMANNQGIITAVFPANERGRALGTTGTFVALGSLVGPPLGGLIVGAFSWEYIFLINVPVGCIIFFLALKILPKSNRTAAGKLDVTGAVLFMFAIIPLFAAIGKGQEIGFSQPIVLSGFFIALIALIAFVLVEKKKAEPLLDLEIFKNKLFSLSLFCGFLSFVAIFCTNIIQPFYFQDVLAYSPSFAGLVLMISPIILTVVSPFSGYLSDKIGSEMLTFSGLLMTSLALLLMSTLNDHSSLTIIVIYIAVLSVGNGLFQSPNNSLIMSTVPKHKLGIAGSTNALIRNLGMVCGIALSTTLLYNRMSDKIGYPVTDYVVGRNDAFVYGMSIVYIVAAAICMIGAVLTAYRLLNRKSRRQDIGVLEEIKK